MKKRFGGRWAAFLLVLVLLFSLTACGSGNKAADVADAEGDFGALHWVYKHDSQTLTVSGSGVIPNSAKASDVNWMAVREGVVNLVISEDITEIGDYAFYYMPYLTSVSMPSTVTRIGNQAFAFCKSLTGISLPSGLATVGSSAFEGCASLKAISLPASCVSVGDRAFAYCRSMEKFFSFGTLSSVGHWTFKDCAALKEVVFSSSVSDAVLDGTAFEGVPEGYAIKKTSSVDGTSTVTVSFINEAGEAVHDSVSVTKAYGESHTFNAPSIEGLTPDKTHVDVIFDLDDQTLFVTYKSNATEQVPEEETTEQVVDATQPNSPWMIVGIVIMVVVLAGVAVLAVVIMRMDKKGGKNSQTVRKKDNGNKKK